MVIYKLDIYFYWYSATANVHFKAQLLTTMAIAMNGFALLRPLTVRALGTVRTLGFVRVSNIVSGVGNRRLFHLPINSRRNMTSVSATNDEEASARAAAATAGTGSPTIFDKIIAKEIPSSIVYEDEKVLAFRDINPQAPVHVLIIPKLRDGLTELGKAEERHEEILGHLLYAAKIVAEKEGVVDGFRVVINSGPTACQSVYHLHLHVLGGRQMKWPPG